MKRKLVRVKTVMPMHVWLATFLGLIHGIHGFVAHAQENFTSQRTNVLFIAIDDLRPALGCYGDPLAKSPHLDRFAQSARQFNRAYVQQAVCGPSRTSLLTGRLPDHTRVWHNRHRFRKTLPKSVTLPQLFKQSGYHTLALGKIFSGDERELDPVSWSKPELVRRKGWKNYLLPHNQGKAMKQAAYEASDVADDAYPDGKLADLAVDTLESLKQNGQPFFLAVGFFKPHLPFNAPKKYWDLHDAKSFSLPEDALESVHMAPDLARHSHRELGGYRDVPKDEDVDQKQSQSLRHGYYACVSYVDAQVGKVLDALHQLQLDQNTTVVIWGDHGFALGETNRWCKGTNFELDTRIPLLIRTPDLADPGVATNALVETVDLYPSLAALAGLDLPHALDGRSFVSLLKNPHLPGRDAVLSQFTRPWKNGTPATMGYSIRTQNERYTRWLHWQSKEIVAEELYDYASSQSTTQRNANLIEHRNVANSRPQLLGRMSQQMDQVLTSRLNVALD